MTSSRRAQGPSSIDSRMSSNIGGTVSPFQSGGQPITPPPTPPRHHYYPRHISHDYPSSSSSPSPSPSVSSSAFSSTTRLHQTEWIYRRPKSSSPANNNTLFNGRRSATGNASCPSPQRSPSISSRAYHDNTPPTRGSKHRRRVTAMPTPSSPILISSTSQLVDSPESISKSPSNTIGLRGSANASVSSLQLQSSIRVSPLKHKLHGSPYLLRETNQDPYTSLRHANAMSPGLQRSTSSTSTKTNNSASTAIWSAIRAKSGTQAERNRILKSVPSSSQIVTGSSVMPTFTVPVPSLPLTPTEATPPRVPPKDRNTFNGTGTPSLLPSFSHTDKGRQTRRRDKFASAPPIPVPAGTNVPTSSAASTRFGVISSSAPSSHYTGAGTSTSPSSLSGASNSTIRISANGRSRAPRNRTASLNSQSSIATTTTSHTVATTGTTSSSTSSRLHPYTPTLPSSTIPVSPGVYNFRTSSHSSTGTPPSYLHGYGNGEKKYPHQRQNSSSSDICINDGSTAAAAAARSQAYAQLTGASSAKRRPSTTSSGSEAPPYLHLYSNSHPYSYQARSNFGGSSVSSFQGRAHGSAGTLIATPLSASSRRPSLPPPSSSSVSLSHNGGSYVSRSPRTPITPQTSQLPPPKAKSILTRTSSMSTKNSGCGGTVKSVKFVEIPEIHYRSGFSEEDGNELMFGETSSLGDEDDDDNDGISAVGARGEGQEGIVLRDCMGIDVEAIDMDIDTYLGGGSPDEEESKLDFKRKQGLGWNFLRGRKHERDTDKGKELKKTANEKESSASALEPKKEKEKSNSALGFKKLMSLTSRKAPPPPLTLSIGPPIPLHFKPPLAQTQENTTTRDIGKRQASVSPSRKPISGPYALGSHLPSRSPLPPSPSSSFIHRLPATPARSSSNTSLNRSLSSLSRRNHHNYSSTSVNYGDRPHWNAHGRNQSSTPYTGPRRTGSLERPVGLNVAHIRPKGIMNQDVPGLDSARPTPLKNAPSYESFRSAKSYGGRSVRSEVGSVKSSKSIGAGSLRGFRTWVKKVSAHTGTSIPVAVVE